MTPHHVVLLRRLLNEEKGVLVPGAPNALTARIIDDLGFKGLYVTGAGVTNMFLGLPDLGFVGLSQMAEHVAAIRGITDLPVLVDAETGFGNALNVTHTVRTLEQAGASAIQIEDQLFPKRCGHFAGKQLISQDEMVGKLRAALDTRRNDTLIIARTDARGVEGFESAIARAERYIETGADVIFVEALETLSELESVPNRLKAPQLLNLVLGGKTPTVDAETASNLGFSLVLYANAALQAAIRGIPQALRELRERGTLDERAVASFSERQRLVGKAAFDALEARYRD